MILSMLYWCNYPLQVTPQSVAVYSDITWIHVCCLLICDTSDGHIWRLVPMLLTVILIRLILLALAKLCLPATWSHYTGTTQWMATAHCRCLRTVSASRSLSTLMLLGYSSKLTVKQMLIHIGIRYRIVSYFTVIASIQHYWLWSSNVQIKSKHICKAP